MDKGMVRVYVEASKASKLIIRTNLAFWIRPESWLEDSDTFVAQRQEVESLGDDLLSASTVKFFADGVFGSATASVKAPYESEPSSHGQPVWSVTELNNAVANFSKLGFQIHIHAIGDAGVAMALDAIEAAGAPKNSVIAHTELVDEVDIPRFKDLDVVANFEPLWAREDGMLTSCIHHLGRIRIDSMYRLRDFLDAGARISFGSDWPVSSPDPLLGLFTATHRALPETPNNSWTPEQRLNASEALAAYTVAVAAQLELATSNADLVVLSGNPLTEDLLKLEVTETIVDGKTVYASK
jgi:predicted amidohydrolase YtcJ